jgi:flagellar assembly protein FliH
LSEVLKLRASRAGLKISRAVSVLPQVSSGSSSRRPGPPENSAAGQMRGGGFVGVDDLETRIGAEYQRGVVDGQRKAEESVRARVSEGIQAEHQRVEKLFGHAAEQWAGFFAASEEAIVKFAFGVAERIVRKEISLDRAIVVEQIKEGIGRVLGVESVKIRVHPGDLPLVRQQKGSIQSSGDALRDIVVDGDESLEPGDCIIESDMGNIDARISTQLKQIENALFESKVISQ